MSCLVVVETQLWNELSLHIKMSPILDTFNSRPKTYFLAFNVARELCGICLSFTVLNYCFYCLLVVFIYLFLCSILVTVVFILTVPYQ